jgi:hypothetical protein
MEKRNARFCDPKERVKLVSLVAPQKNNNRKRMCPGSKSHQDNQNTNTADAKDQIEGISPDKPNGTWKSGQ